jgi:hypothetical protein
VPDRQRRVLVRAAGQGLVDEQVARHHAHGVKHARVADAEFAHPIDHAIAHTR